MNRSLLGISALFALAGGAAVAADLPVPQQVYKAPAVVAAPPYSWSGWYAGGNVGYSWGRAKTGSVGDVTIDGAGLTVITAGGPTFSQIVIPGATTSHSQKLNGVIGGLQLGANLQMSNWLLGFETDFQGSGEKGSGTRIDPFLFNLPDTGCNAPTCFADGTSTTNYTAKIGWFGTVRGRVGFVADRFLVYGTGGLAYGQVKVSGVNTTNITVHDCCEPHLAGTFVTPFSASKVKAGWTGGAGVEGAAWSPAWTWKIEYLYMDLGKLHVVTPVRFDTKFTDNIVRVGLNYRFGGATY